MPRGAGRAYRRFASYRGAGFYSLLDLLLLIGILYFLIKLFLVALPYALGLGLLLLLRELLRPRPWGRFF